MKKKFYSDFLLSLHAMCYPCGNLLKRYLAKLSKPSIHFEKYVCIDITSISFYISLIHYYGITNLNSEFIIIYNCSYPSI